MNQINGSIAKYKTDMPALLRFYQFSNVLCSIEDVEIRNKLTYIYFTWVRT